MYKIAVMGDYDSIYGFAALGLAVFPVRNREEAGDTLRRLAEGNTGSSISLRLRQRRSGMKLRDTVTRQFRRSYRYRACPEIPAPEWRA